MADASTYDWVKLAIETLLSTPVVAGVAIYVAVSNETIRSKIQELDFFGIKVKLNEVQKDVAATKAALTTLEKSFKDMETGYLDKAASVEQHASLRDVDALARTLKRDAAVLDNIDFVTELLKPGADAEYVYAAACAIQVRPQPRWFDLICDYLDWLAGARELGGLRLRYVYRIILALEKIVTADNHRDEAYVDAAQRDRARAILANLRKKKRVVEDPGNADDKGLFALIDRLTAKL